MKDSAFFRSRDPIKRIERREALAKIRAEQIAMMPVPFCKKHRIPMTMIRYDKKYPVWQCDLCWFSANKGAITRMLKRRSMYR